MERDTHFSGFAKLLLDELLKASVITVETPFQDDWRAEWEETIAQRAYDLVKHTLNRLAEGDRRYDLEDPMEVENIPDITSWRN